MRFSADNTHRLVYIYVWNDVSRELEGVDDYRIWRRLTIPLWDRIEDQFVLPLKDCMEDMT